MTLGDKIITVYEIILFMIQDLAIPICEEEKWVKAKAIT